jgi:hypothetical protein
MTHLLCGNAERAAWIARVPWILCSQLHTFLEWGYKSFLLLHLNNLLHLIHHIPPSHSGSPGNGYLLNCKAWTYCCIWSVKTWECSIWEEDSLLVGVRMLLSLSEVQEISESLRKVLQPHSGCPGVFELRSWMIIF